MHISIYMYFSQVIIFSLILIQAFSSWGAEQSLCSVFISRVEGVHTQPVETLTQEAVNLDGCKKQAQEVMKSMCALAATADLHFKAKFDYFDAKNFDIKKGAMDIRCQASKPDQATSSI
ncbi:MAG: hypothetical protein R2827_16080 [Bdellovibrionales bacterium]